MENKDKHFDMIFRLIVVIVAFGMAFSVFLVVWFEKEVAERFADTSQMFWLTTGVGGSLGYLIGSSVGKRKENTNGETTAEITATIKKTDE